MPERVIVLRITVPDGGITADGMREQIEQDFADVGLEGKIEVVSETISTGTDARR